MNKEPVAAGKSSFDLVDTEKVFNVIAARPNSCFLDLACGVGKYCIEIARQIGEHGKVYAIDLWQEGLELLTDNADTLNLKNIETILADITGAIPVPDNSGDACLIATVLHDLNRAGQQSVLREVARLLKPGGTLNIIEFKKLDFGPGPPIDVRLSEGDVDALVLASGFEKLTSLEVGDYTYLMQYKKTK